VIELLLKHGADVSVISTKGEFAGKTLLDIALEKKYDEAVEILREHGAKTGAELDEEEKKGSEK
jgi:ankyrin repeat protein